MKRGWVKGICAVLCVLLLNAGVWGCVLGGAWMIDRLEGGFWQSALYGRELGKYIDLVSELVERKGEEQSSAYAKQRLNELTEMLDMKNTNFRFVVTREEDGAVLYANAGDVEQWMDQVYDVCETAWPEYYNGSWVGYHIEYGVFWPLSAQDGFAEQLERYNTLDAIAAPVLAGSVACCAVALALLIVLMCAAGRRKDREGVVLNWHDKIPYDLYLAAEIVAQSIIWGIVFLEGFYYLEFNWDGAGVLWVAGAAMGGSILILAFLLTTVTRIKARTLLRNTIIWRLCGWIAKWVKWGYGAVKSAFAALPLIWKAALVCGGYLLLGLILAECSLFLWFLLTAALMAYVCWWILQWKRIRLGTEKIIGGDPNYHIDSQKMPPDLKRHADELNNLSQAISAAVDERMKSEHFKAELITNVSHDLKTPLTSIINYVDLLKKEKIDNPKAQEYIEVLDRKSQRLKKLTEDLIEASKASTGALTVSKERLDVVQLIRQALGEYEEKLSAAGLTLVTALPEEALYINADGRHVWRVLDNLLNNCAKYAMEGTRVYLNAAARAESVAVTVKNISRQELNVPPEQLMERFVRGDESRTTEGSGLGLSIARSLTELQGGRFWLEIDGDLFKANVAFPLAGV